MGKLNCWDYKKCGRELGGHMSKERTVCPASMEMILDRVHEGKNAGRTCGVVAGTMCGGDVQGSFAAKYKNCKVCDFYQKVHEEEGAGFILSATLLAKMNKHE